MVIIINPFAAGNTAIEKWDRVKNSILDSCKPQAVEFLRNGRSLDQILVDALSSKERDFVAAGGDGTVNLVLNGLMKLAQEGQLPTLRLGALGLGSSNDFHKPFTLANMIDGIPGKIRFEAVRPRDIGCVTYKNGDQTESRYFLANASVGITAEANFLFNNPDRILRRLKRFNTQAAILYAALKTIIRYRNIDVALFGSWGCESAHLANLGIVKNPHFSGDLCYTDQMVLDNGKLSVHLCHDMTRLNLLRLLWVLGRGKFQKVRKKKSYEANWLAVSSGSPFTVEFDGEILSTTSASFSVLHKYFQVCP